MHPAVLTQLKTRSFGMLLALVSYYFQFKCPSTPFQTCLFLSHIIMVIGACRNVLIPIPMAQYSRIVVPMMSIYSVPSVSSQRS
jgi:hypothetical protein